MANVLDEGGSPILDEGGGFIADELGPDVVVVAQQRGSWWGLDSVFKQSREEFQEFISRPPLACPDDGEPLMPPPATVSGSGIELYCRYCGWQYPRDWVAPSRPGY